MPPSTAMRNFKPSFRRQAAACWILGRHSVINPWPPKPGLTVMISSESIRSKKGLTLDMAVGGLMAKPTCLPGERIFQISELTFPSNSI